jgi:hypothetical protein
MWHAIAIENIEELRSQLGIEDRELREAIRGLRVGDLIRLTFLPGEAPNAGETLEVRITRIDGSHFRGKLMDGPTSPGLSHLRRGASVGFTKDEIHSLAKGS